MAARSGTLARRLAQTAGSKRSSLHQSSQRHYGLPAGTSGSSALPVGFALEPMQNYNPDWTESQHEVRAAISQIMQKYDDEYWLHIDGKGEFPHALTKDLAAGGWLGIWSVSRYMTSARISELVYYFSMPEEYGGSAMGISEAAVMMQTISESGGGLTGAS